MIPSRFNIVVPDFPGTGKHILYNARSQAQVVIDNELQAALGGLPAVPSRPETMQAFGQLEKMGFVVASEEVDDLALQAFFQRIQEDTRILRPTVLTTYACNFACTYCVEQGVKQGAPMTAEAAASAVDYIKSQLVELGSREIHLTFYGGEPLLNLAAVRSVALSLKAFADERTVPFSISFSTNGALLTRKIVQELKPLGLKGAKITLDGPREVHNRNRPFRNGDGSFDVLVGNIESVVDLTSVVLEINFNPDNAPRIGELLDFLAGRGLHTKLTGVIFSPISPVPKDREGARPAAEVTCALMTLESTRQLVELQTMALRKGFSVDTTVSAHVCEMMSKRSNFIIDPEGRLYRCGGLAGRREFSFGTIAGEKRDPWMGKELWRRCASCAYAPLCGDGCPFGSYVRWGDPLRLNCGKESMEHLVRESLKLTYLQKEKKKQS